MRRLLSTPLKKLVLPLLGAAVMNSAAFAQAKEPLPDVPPPPPEMEAFDESMEPEVTIVQKGEEKREEYRLRGKLYMIKVTPAVGPAYYLVDQLGNGEFVQRDITHGVVSPPKWILLSW